MGEPIERCRAAVIMVHGRGAAPPNILELVPLIDRAGVAYLAPAADGNSWYPFSFLADIDRNEPHLSSGLQVLSTLVTRLIAQGLARERIVLLGFSQGACLAGEFAVRHAARYGGVVMLSGGLIGPPGTRWDQPPAFDGTSVFLGCSDSEGVTDMLKEFKEFALKGNVVDLAVGFIIGGAFGTVVTSLVNDILMPPLGFALGGADFSSLFIVLREGATAGPYVTPDAATEAGAVTMNVGLFVNSIISFLILAFALFMVVRTMNRLRREEAAAPAPPPGPTPDQKLLTEIRDLLARR